MNPLTPGQRQWGLTVPALPGWGQKQDPHWAAPEPEPAEALAAWAAAAAALKVRQGSCLGSHHADA